jgi:hypothetical protein
MAPLTLKVALSPLNAIHGHGRIDGKPHRSKERHAPKERVIDRSREHQSRRSEEHTMSQEALFPRRMVVGRSTGTVAAKDHWNRIIR